MLSKKNRLSILLILIILTTIISSSITYFFLKHKNQAKKQNFSGNFTQNEESISNNESMNLKLYFLNPDSNEFDIETRIVQNKNSTLKNIENVISELIKGPRTSLHSTIPDGTQLLNIFVHKDKNLYLNFNELFKYNHPCGTESEYQTIYSLYKTIFDNFHNIEKIDLLIEGEQIKTLCGHLDLNAPFEALVNFNFQDGCLNSELLNSLEFNDENERKSIPDFDRSTKIPFYKPEEYKKEAIEEIKIN